MLGLMLSAVLLAQAAPAADAEVRAISLTVLDAKGDAVEGLGAKDVALLENGVARDITAFGPDLRSLTAAVIVDTSEVVSSAYRLNMVEPVVGLVARLPEGSRYAIWTTGDRPTKILDYTDDRAAASKALKLVAPRGGNYVLDALAEASADMKAEEGRRRVVVAVTATGPELSYRDKYRAAETAEKSADLFLLLQISAGGADFEQQGDLGYVLDRLATTTGGVHEVILSSLGTDSGLHKLSAALRSQYRLAYATLPRLRTRKLQVELARPGTRVVVPRRSEVEP